jgi:transcriptional regulator with XRE-family HTH domain
MHPERVGARLRLLRESAGLSSAELCRTLQINKSSYSLFEKGKRVVPEYVKVSLADYYGTTLDYLTLGRAPEREVQALLARLRQHRENIS